MAGNPFLLAPEVNANPLLSDSWSRCQRYGLDPATEDFPRLGAGELADRLASHRGLQQLAQPVVEALSRQVADLQSVVILSDPDGLVLHTLGDTQALQKAQRVALAPGNLWSESGRGTNAIGTALAIDDGTLQQVLAPSAQVRFAIHAVWPEGPWLPQKTRAAIDALREGLPLTATPG